MTNRFLVYNAGGYYGSICPCLRYASHQLPGRIRDALLAINRAYHLYYSAIDLIYTPDGDYVFLELNPVGQFGWLERHTGIPLYHTLAKFLGSPPNKEGI